MNIVTFIQTRLAAKAENSERGAGYAEYGLLVALIAIVAAVGVGAFGTFLNGFFNGIQNTF